MIPFRRSVIVFLSAGALLATSALALAAGKPVKGATYSGQMTQKLHSGGKTFVSHYPISFKISANGKKVSSFVFASGYPVYCQGGGFGSPVSSSAKISKKGSFKAKLRLYFAPGHSYQGFLIVTGKFAKQSREAGTVKTDFSKFSSCNGTAKYSTKG